MRSVGTHHNPTVHSREDRHINEPDKVVVSDLRRPLERFTDLNSPGMPGDTLTTAGQSSGGMGRRFTIVVPLLKGPIALALSFFQKPIHALDVGRRWNVNRVKTGPTAFE